MRKRLSRRSNWLLPIGLIIRMRAPNIARCALPPGGELAKDFELISESGQTSLARLFGEKDTLMVDSMMYGPQRKAACPMCTSRLSAWKGVAVNLRQRLSIAVIGRSPIEGLVDFKEQRGFANLPFASDLSGE
jgi:predicted dithiol-disulfide oxidoreductase (DUF899 family)